MQQEPNVLTVVLKPDLKSYDVELFISYKEQGEDKQYNKPIMGWVTYRDESQNEQKAVLQYSQGNYHAKFTYLYGTQPVVHVKAGPTFEPYQRPMLSPNPMRVELNYAKPFLYMYINPNEQLRRGSIKDHPSNFLHFKKQFLYLVESLTIDKNWKQSLSKIFVYSVNRYQEPIPLLETGMTKVTWDRQSYEKMINQIRLGNSYVPYNQVVQHARQSLQGYRFASGNNLQAVVLYILGAPPTPIFDPDEELRDLENLLGRHKILAVVAQFADNNFVQRQDITATSRERFDNLRLLELDVIQEFHDQFFGNAREYIKAILTQILKDDRQDG